HSVRDPRSDHGEQESDPGKDRDRDAVGSRQEPEDGRKNETRQKAITSAYAGIARLFARRRMTWNCPATEGSASGFGSEGLASPLGRIPSAAIKASRDGPLPGSKERAREGRAAASRR